MNIIFQMVKHSRIRLSLIYTSLKKRYRLKSINYERYDQLDFGEVQTRTASILTRRACFNNTKCETILWNVLRRENILKIDKQNRVSSLLVPSSQNRVASFMVFTHHPRKIFQLGIYYNTNDKTIHGTGLKALPSWKLALGFGHEQ